MSEKWGDRDNFRITDHDVLEPTDPLDVAKSALRDVLLDPDDMSRKNPEYVKAQCTLAICVMLERVAAAIEQRRV